VKLNVEQKIEPFENSLDVVTSLSIELRKETTCLPLTSDNLEGTIADLAVELTWKVLFAFIGIAIAGIGGTATLFLRNYLLLIQLLHRMTPLYLTLFQHLPGLLSKDLDPEPTKPQAK